MLDGLLGPYWKAAERTFLLSGSVIQLIVCARLDRSLISWSFLQETLDGNQIWVLTLLTRFGRSVNKVYLFGNQENRTCFCCLSSSSKLTFGMNVVFGLIQSLHFWEMKIIQNFKMVISDLNFKKFQISNINAFY